MSTHRNNNSTDLHPLAFVSPNSKAYINELHSRIQFQHDPKDLATFITNVTTANLKSPVTGERPIHVAARVGHLSALHLLYRNGANLNAKCNLGNTALHISIHNNNYWCSRFLISRGVSKDVVNNIGIPAWAGVDGVCLYPSFLKALQTATTNKMVSIAFELLQKTPDRIKLDEYLQVVSDHKLCFPHLWRKSVRKKNKKVKRMIKRCNLIDEQQLNRNGSNTTDEQVTAEAVFETIRNSMNDKLEKIIHVFRRFDTDNSGEIDRKELLYGLRDLNVRLNQHQIKLFIETIDPNNDGTITFLELKQALKKTTKKDEERRRDKYQKLPEINKTSTTAPSKKINKNKKCPKKSPKLHRRTAKKKQGQFRTVILHEDIGGPVPIKFDDGAKTTSPYFDGSAWTSTLPGIKTATP